MRCMSPLMADFVAEVGHLRCKDAAFDFLKPFFATPLGYSTGLMWCPGRFQRLRGTNCEYWRRSSNQFGEPAKVLGDSCHRELELGAVRAT